MRVLIIEDEQKLAKNIAMVLSEGVGYVCDIATNGVDGLHQAQDLFYNMIVLDLSLPGLDGMQILQTLRQKQISTPVLILSARDSQQDIIKGFNSGSDDYMTKPFDISELLARCKALIRRSFGKPNTVISLGPIKIDTLARTVTCEGNSISLTAMEYKTLEYLALSAGQVISKTQLLEQLYDFNWESYSNTIEVFVSSIRRKLRLNTQSEIIRTVRGHGYIIEAS